MTSVATTISWVWVHSWGDTRHYERVSSEDSHLLTLDYSETGPVEISVTFSSHLCNKTTVTHYLGNVLLSCGVWSLRPSLSPSFPPLLPLSPYIYNSTVEGVLTSVYLRSRTLVIESIDCISSPQNYRIIITTPPTTTNVSFNETVEYNL